MLQLSPDKRRLLFKILPYPIIFFIGSLLYANVEYGIIGQSETYPTTDARYDPLNSLVTLLTMNTILGLVLGTIEEIFFKNRFKRLAFSMKILMKTILYVFIFVSSLLLFSIILNALNAGSSLTDPLVYKLVFEFFNGYTPVSVVIYAGFFISISLFFTEIVDSLGIDIIWNFFTGKYSRPVYEQRIFMFLDMKNSTSIAENLKNKKYYELINDYYSEMTNAIVQTHGTIYQYVGDEIVISWKLEEGLINCNCLRCYFKIKERIDQNADYFLSRYGLIPQFRAGFHSGEVTRGQVGQIKRDLLYIGDVLNAAARIQGLCKQLEADLLISAQLKEELPDNDFQFIPKGEFELRGRQKQEELFTVKKPILNERISNNHKDF